ncbi:hypothetical protein ABIA45_001775 [Bradyrhizobium sp. USDA 336]
MASTRKPYDPSARRVAERKANGAKPHGVAPTAFFRIKEYGPRLGVDPRLTTVLGRMGMFKELSDAEVDAGFRIAEVYGRYEWLKGLPRRSAASPSYEHGFGTKEIHLDRLTQDELKRHNKAVRRAQKAFDQMLGCIGSQHALIERVCVLNQEPGPIHKSKLAAVLHKVAIQMGLIVDTGTKPKPKVPTKDDGALLAEAAVDALVQWFGDRNSKPTHFSLVNNSDWKASRGITGSDGRYHHTIVVPLRDLTAEQMDGKLRLACAVAGMLETTGAETGDAT